jgi:hypothetical protein
LQSFVVSVVDDIVVWLWVVVGVSIIPYAINFGCSLDELA